MRDDGLEISNHAFKIQRRRRIAAEIGGCDYCPPHGGENYNLKGHKPKADKYKSKRKGKI